MTQANDPDVQRPVFRFAPSPNGRLHLGHALSALLNLKMARESGGRMLLRIEDIDRVRCTPKLEAMMLEDLRWIGFEWDEPPRRQSEHFDEYKAALDDLRRRGLVYPAFLTRSAIKGLTAEIPGWPADPDGAPLYPLTERALSPLERDARIAAGEDFALRLDMDKAVEAAGGKLQWSETGFGPDGETGIIPGAAAPMGRCHPRPQGHARQLPPCMRYGRRIAGRDKCGARRRPFPRNFRSPAVAGAAGHCPPRHTTITG